MPRSRSKRSSYKAPARRKPRSSPKWLPLVGLGLTGAGVTLVLLTYILSLPLAGLNLLVGFGLMAGGLVALSRYH